MCWACDHPDATFDDYLAHLRGFIDAHGWAVQGVERDRIHPPWAYTIGLTQHDRPELLITGMPLRRAGALLNGVAAHLLHAEVPALRQEIAWVGGPVIQLLEVAEPSAHLLRAIDLYGPRVRALQVVHADDRGHWPWQRGYRGVRGGQPVLGVAEDRRASA